MTKSTSKSLRAALSEGWRVTFGVATLAALWVLVGYWVTDGANVRRVGLTLLESLMLYAGAAAVSGVAYGLTRPWRYRFWGRVCSGIVVGSVVGLVLSVAVLPEESLKRIAIVGVVYGLLIGGAWGAVWMRQPADVDEDEQDLTRLRNH